MFSLHARTKTGKVKHPIGAAALGDSGKVSELFRPPRNPNFKLFSAKNTSESLREN